MKNKLTAKTALCFLFAILITVFCSVTAFADDLDGDGYDDVTGDPVIEVQTDAPFEPETEYVEPETEYIEPQTEPQDVWTEPATQYVEPQTEPQEVWTEAETQYVVVQNETVAQATTEFVAPTLAKTVSEKSYSTNYTFGVISWICVIVGIIVVAAVLISNKVSGRKSMGRV